MSTNDIGLTAEEAREAAGISPLSNYWHRCSDLRDMEPCAIKYTGHERPGPFGLAQMVSEITPYGVRLAEALLREGFAMFPAPRHSARNSDPHTSHAAAADRKRRTRANTQMAQLLLAYYREWRDREM